MKLWIKLKNKFVQLEVSEIDCAALAYLIYAQKKLHNYHVTNFGFDHGVVKYSNLLGLMNELNELCHNFKEGFIIGKIFDPTLLDVFDDAF
uniref:Uncharacterized protein n=1 Tax=Acrobeloides nanus TaxID=290746 RepID=A0A914BUQ7_9BILA